MAVQFAQNIGATIVTLELLGNTLGDAPVLEQDAPALGIALLQRLGLFDPVGAEVAEIAAHLAPGGDHARTVEEGERNRPDYPLGLLALLVAVGDLDLALLADRLADGRQVDRLRHRLEIGRASCRERV